MTGTFHEAILFLVNTIFDLYLFILAARVLLAWAGSNYFDPVTQFVVKLTDFIVKPLRRYIRNYRGIEISTIIVILLLEVIKYMLISAITFGVPNIVGVFILAFGDSLKLIIQCFFYAILLQVILSWVQPGSPMTYTLYQITAPIMRPIQRVIPQIGGIDISPIPAMIGLQLLLIILVNPIMSLGLGVAFG